MIAYLKGSLLDVADNHWIIATGSDASQVGYQVMIPNQHQYHGMPNGRSVELWIHTHVREDQLELFGFQTAGEKRVFLMLLSVNGIGPKGGMAVMSAISPVALLNAVMDEDQAMLTKVPGIGKKTAERILLDLRDPIRKQVEKNGSIERFLGIAETRGGAVNSVNRSTLRPKHSGDSAVGVSEIWLREAEMALLGLGYQERSVKQAIDAALEVALESTPSAPLAWNKTEDVILAAMKHLR